MVSTSLAPRGGVRHAAGRRVTGCVHTVFVLVAATVALTAAGASARADDAPPLPRYGFEPGQHLVYSGSETLAAPPNEVIVERRAEIRVVEALATGGWRLVVTHRHQRFIERGGEREGMRPREDLYVTTLAPDGTIADRGADAFGVLDRLLPALPPDRAAAEGGSWTYASADVRHVARGLERRTEGEGGAAWRFTVVPASHRDELNGFSSSYAYELSVPRGRIERLTAEHRHRDRVTRTAEDRLVEVRAIEPGELAALRHDAARCAAAEAEYERRLARALGGTPSEAAPAKLDEALAGLEAARDEMRSEMLGAYLAARVAGHRASAAVFTRRLRAQAGILGRPAPDWSLQSLDGTTHDLAEYRGRVVVLDFWYRNCGWCIRAMPQLDEVARRYAGRPVAVLGVNTDRAVSDARHVVERVRPAYPTLLGSSSLARAYTVQSYPTLAVIGPDGAVRYIHRGYTGTLARELSDVIDELLAAR